MVAVKCCRGNLRGLWRIGVRDVNVFIAAFVLVCVFGDCV